MPQNKIGGSRPPVSVFVIKRPARGKPWRGDWGLHLSSCTVLMMISSTYQTIARIVTTLVGVFAFIYEMPPPRHHAAESGIGIIGTRAMTVKKNGAAVREKNSGHQATCAWWP